MLVFVRFSYTCITDYNTRLMKDENSYAVETQTVAAFMKHLNHKTQLTQDMFRSLTAIDHIILLSKSVAS